MLFVSAHGARIPALGFGTFRQDDKLARRMVTAALETGYRHIDTAQMYGNEAGVGQAIAETKVPREEIWLTTKVWPDRFRDGELQRSVEASVRRLRTEPDLVLLHWPSREVPLAETVGALNQVRRDGLCRHIGISNFTTGLIGEAWRHTAEPLVLNQVEYHPFLSQKAVLEATRAKGMGLTAYAPIAHGKVFANETLRQIGERHGKNGGQVTLRWLIQQEGVCAIPGSSKEANLRANFDIFDFELSEEEMADIDSLGSPKGRIVNPTGTAPAWD
jgi:diketogulonate reductase-like aldo/keto reductase